MTPIQFILLAGLLTIGWLYYRLLRHRPLWRIIIVAVFLVGGYFVLFPDSTTVIAQALGVDRGADLFSYIGILLGYAGIGWVYHTVKRIERRQELIIRALALDRASYGDHATEKPS